MKKKSKKQSLTMKKLINISNEEKLKAAKFYYQRIKDDFRRNYKNWIKTQKNNLKSHSMVYIPNQQSQKTQGNRKKSNKGMKDKEQSKSILNKISVSKSIEALTIMKHKPFFRFLPKAIEARELILDICHKKIK